MEVWQHHLRAFNKMADTETNAVMDLHAGVQTTHPSNWRRTATLDSYLVSNYRECAMVCASRRIKEICPQL
jgi:hypothetical protein